jgi:hypothetical protein
MDSNTMHYILFFVLFIIGQSLTMVGSFISLPYKNLSMWESIKMTLPFVWLDWIFLTFAIYLFHKYSLLTNTQFLFTLIVFQFGATLLINKFYLKQKINISDYVAIALLIVGYIISEFHLFSKLFKLPIPEEAKKEKDTKENASGGNANVNAKKDEKDEKKDKDAQKDNAAQK